MTAPLLIDVAPELVEELRRLLTQEAEGGLAERVGTVRIMDRCRCGDNFCATFYTAPRPDGAFGAGHRTIALVPSDGLLNVDAVGSEIVQIEVLFRDDFKAKLLAFVP